MHGAIYVLLVIYLNIPKSIASISKRSDRGLTNDYKISMVSKFCDFVHVGVTFLIPFIITTLRAYALGTSTIINEGSQQK